MSDLVPEEPEDSGVPTEVPELSDIESARILANDARSRLHDEGFEDSQIDDWADTFVSEVGSGDVEEFIEWIRVKERGG